MNDTDTDDEDDTNTGKMEPQEADPGEEHYKDPLIGEGSGEESVQVL